MLRERMRAREQVIEDHAEAVDVGSGSNLLPTELFRAREFRSHEARCRLRCRRVSRIHEFRNAEVHQLRSAVVRNQNVGGLDVSVHDQILVGILNRRANAEE